MPTGEWDDCFATLLARLRHAAGYTQEQLAHRAELSVRAISSLECGSRLPRRLTLDRLSRALGLSAIQRGALAPAAARDRNPPAPDPAGALLPIAAPAGVPLHGRDTELAELCGHLSGDGPAVYGLSGEPGMGKSRLLAEAIRLAGERHVPVLAGAARRDGEPYAPITDALADHLRRAPGALLGHQLAGCAGLELLLPELRGRPWGPAGRPPPLRGAPPERPDDPRGWLRDPTVAPAAPSSPGEPATDPAAARRLVFGAVGHFLANIAGSGRILLVLDDVQWAGPGAAELLGYLVRHGSRQLRVVIAGRTGMLAGTGALPACATELARLHQVHARRLAPLAPADADALIAAVAAGAELAPATRARILRRSGGHPLYLVELTRAALAGDPATVPWHLRMTVAQQLAPLPEATVRCLRRMAALSRGAVPAERLATADLGLEQVLDHLDAARLYRLVEETRAGFRFRYPLVREVLAGGVGPARRRLWRTAPGTAHPATTRHLDIAT